MLVRPNSPLITHGATVRTALAIIDAEGIDALSLPRIARELNVKAPSLYHHFADKDEILAAVSKAIIAKTVVPAKPASNDWQEWFAELAMNFRAAVLRHRKAAPILLRFMPRDLLTRIYEEAAAYLAACGVPPEGHIPILDGLEKLAIGATLAEAMHEPRSGRVQFSFDDPDAHPHLIRANAARTLDAGQLYELAVRSYLLGVATLSP